MINTRDERSYVIGKTVEFISFDEAKNYFINKLEKFVEVTIKEKDWDSYYLILLLCGILLSKSKTTYSGDHHESSMLYNYIEKVIR